MNRRGRQLAPVDGVERVPLVDVRHPSGQCPSDLEQAPELPLIEAVNLEAVLVELEGGVEAAEESGEFGPLGERGGDEVGGLMIGQDLFGGIEEVLENNLAGNVLIGVLYYNLVGQVRSG